MKKSKKKETRNCRGISHKKCYIHPKKKKNFTSRISFHSHRSTLQCNIYSISMYNVLSRFEKIFRFNFSQQWNTKILVSERKHESVYNTHHCKMRTPLFSHGKRTDLWFVRHVLLFSRYSLLSARKNYGSLFSTAYTVRI